MKARVRAIVTFERDEATEFWHVPESAARAVYMRMADKLIELTQAAPVQQ